MSLRNERINLGQSNNGFFCISDKGLPTKNIEYVILLSLFQEETIFRRRYNSPLDFDNFFYEKIIGCFQL